MSANKLTKNGQKTVESGIVVAIATTAAPFIVRALKLDASYIAPVTVVLGAIVGGLYNFIKHSMPAKKAK